MPVLLAFFKPKSYPKVPPWFQVHVGWLVLALVVCVMIWAWSRRDSLRRALCGAEDPRIFAILRVGMAVLLVQSFWEMLPYWRMLWSDEGMFLIDAARSRYGSSALSGWTSDEGFLDAWAIAKYLWGKHSLFLIHGSPDFVRAYMLVYFAVLAVYALGFRSRTTGLLAWMMTLDIYDRNSLYSEGTDSVFRCLFFILIFARTDAAWSLDNWLRVRFERGLRRRQLAAGRVVFDYGTCIDRALSWAWIVGWAGAFCAVVNFRMGGLASIAAIGGVLIGIEAWAGHRIRRNRGLGPDARDETAVTIYPWVPRWPRLLLMFQMAAIYVTTGLVKTGSVWARGDALYYALNMDHFYRFEGWTQIVSAPLALGPFRIATWVVHYWEISFPLVMLGMWLGFLTRYRNTHWARAETARRGQIWLGYLALLAGYLLLYRIAVIILPFCLALPKDKVPPDPSAALKAIHLGFAVIAPAIVAGWIYIARRPITVFPEGLQWKRIRIPPIRIDGEALRAWLLGRRIWLTNGLIFHGFLAAFMNIGMFPFIMMHGYWAFTTSRDLTRPMQSMLDHLDAVAAGRRRGSRISRAGVRVLGPEARRRLREWFRPEAEPDPQARNCHWLWHPNLWSRGLADLRGAPVSAPGVQVAREFHPAVVVVFMLAALALLMVPVYRSELMDLLTTEGEPRVQITWLETAVKLWWLAIAGVALVSCWRRHPFAPATEDAPSRERVGRQVGLPLLSSPLARVVGLSVLLFHTGCVTMKLFPTYPVFATWRGKAKAFFGDWMRVGHTWQSWKMFSPNPPRANSFMQTLVVEADGTEWDLRNNAFRDRPFPWIVNDRMRKMQRRMIGKGKWYLPYWAQYQCRQWVLRTGQAPEEIVVNKLKTRIPSPSRVFFKGPYVPSELGVQTEEVKRVKCGAHAKLPAYIKRRHGLEISNEDLEAERRLNEKTERRDQRIRNSWPRRTSFGGEGPVRTSPSKPPLRSKTTPPPTSPTKPETRAKSLSSPVSKPAAVKP